MGFPLCTHCIISSITLSVSVRAKASWTAEPDFEAARREFPSDKPDSGMCREGISTVRQFDSSCAKEREEFVEVRGIFRGSLLAVPSDEMLYGQHKGRLEIHLSQYTGREWKIR